MLGSGVIDDFAPFPGLTADAGRADGSSQWGRVVLSGSEETGDIEVGRALDGLNGENAY